MRGNAVVAESAQIDYYRAGGTRVASLTGLSGLLGMHAGEQRFAQDVGQRHGKLSEFWKTNELGRIEEIIRELDIDLIYVGQLERHQHPAAPRKTGTTECKRLSADSLQESESNDLRCTIPVADRTIGPVKAGRIYGHYRNCHSPAGAYLADGAATAARRDNLGR